MPCGSGHGRPIYRAYQAAAGARLVAAISVGGALLLLAFRSAALGSDPGRLQLGPQVRLYDTFIWALVFFAPIWLGLSSRAFSRRFIGTAPPESLAFIRILCSGILFVSTLWEDLASTALLPAEAIAPPGLFALVHWLPGMTEFMRDAWLLRLLETTTALLLLLGVLGFRTRWVLPLACIGWLFRVVER